MIPGQGVEATPGIEPGYTALQNVASDDIVPAQSMCVTPSWGG